MPTKQYKRRDPEYNKKYLREWRAARRVAKRCQICGRRSGKKVHCKRCRQKQKEKADGWEKAGLCRHCGKRKPKPRSKLCETCSGHQVRWRDRNEQKGLCRKCGRRKPAPNRKQCQVCLDANRMIQRAVREEVIQAYGGACTCCGETTPEFLHLDHKDNDGNRHRKLVGNGMGVYYWARKHGYPDSLQVLCANCHNAKSFYGICPHQRGKEARNGHRTRHLPTPPTAARPVVSPWPA